MTRKRSWRGFVFIGASVDGYRAGPDGAWTGSPIRRRIRGTCPGGLLQDAPADYSGFIRTVDQIVMGRGTYEKVLTFDSWPYEDTPVIVLSTAVAQGPDMNVTVAGSLTDVFELLDRRRARGVYVDGGRAIQTFLREGLIDGLMITCAPVVLGDGLPLFGFLSHSFRLTHLGTCTSDAGMTSTCYRVV